MAAIKDETLLAQAQNILALTTDLTAYLQKSNIPEPSFALDSADPPDTAEYRKIHAALKTSLDDLQRVIDGPRRWLRAFCCTGYDLGALQVALDFDFFQLVPASGKISLQELAKQAGLDEGRTARIVRQLMTYRIFDEPEPEQFAHSSTSLVMQQDEEVRAVVHYSIDEMLKAAAECNTSLKASPYETHQNESPFVTRHGVGMFEFYKNDPDKARRFSKAMAGLRKMERQLDHLLYESFDWKAISGTVVDVGGGNGHISKTLAKMYPNLDCLVQDSNRAMLDEGESTLSADLAGRVKFMQHSFFDAQPTSGIAAYLIRQCTHNWADPDVVRMFKAIVPGLERASPSTPLLINDIIIPLPGVWERHQERLVRQVDMVMLVNCGAKQRTQAEFAALLHEADPRYEIRKVYDNGSLGLLEVYLKQAA